MSMARTVRRKIPNLKKKLIRKIARKQGNRGPTNAGYPFVGRINVPQTTAATLPQVNHA
jgi:hypothetical protein